MTVRIPCADGAERERAVNAVLAAVRRGDLVIMPTETAYAVATDAFSDRGVTRLHEARGSDPALPVPVMVGRRPTVAGIAIRVSVDAERLMDAFWPGPLTLLLTPQPSLAWDHPEGVPVAVRMPIHPLTLAVLARTGPLAVTTANTPGLPAPLDVDDALLQLGDHVAVALDAGEVLDPGGLPSTVVDATGKAPVIVRIGALGVAEVTRVCPAAVTESLGGVE